MISIGTKVKHEAYGTGTIIKVEDILYRIDFDTRGVVDISKRTADDVLEIVIDAPIHAAKTYTVNEIEKSLIKVLEHYAGLSENVELGSKWTGGKLIMQPGDTALKPKELPIETFFHKIVMVRDRMRVLEQHINSNPKLSDEDKVNMQQYITKVYGTLTSFNVLFRDHDDYFVGEKS